MRPRAAKHPFGPRTDACNRRCSPETLLPGEACGVCRTPPNHPPREQFRTPANTQRLPPSGIMRIKKDSERIRAKHRRIPPTFSANGLKSPQGVSARCARSVSWLAVILRRSFPGAPGGSCGFVRRTVAGPRRILTGFPSIARTSTKNKLKATFATTLRVYHEKENVNRSLQMGPEKRDIKKIICLSLENPPSCRSGQDGGPFPSFRCATSHTTRNESGGFEQTFPPCGFFRAYRLTSPVKERIILPNLNRFERRFPHYDRCEKNRRSSFVRMCNDDD